jgi:hypothetical protein
MNLRKLKQHLFEFTPLGKADKEVRSFLEHRVEDHQMERYLDSLRQYRHVKAVHSGLKILFYASLITSIAASFGLERETALIQQVASYLGTSIIFVLFAVTGYISMIRAENYHVQREILISQASLEDLKFSSD